MQKSGEQNALELTSPANGPIDGVTLPNVDLKSNFYIEFEAAYASEDTTVALQLTGEAKVIPLVLTLDGHGTLSAIRKQAPGFQGKGKRNVLGLERNDKGYVIKLNGEGLRDTVCSLTFRASTLSWGSPFCSLPQVQRGTRDGAA